jgi:hypothetical protein
MRSALVLLLLTVAPALAAAEEPRVTQRDVVEIWVQPLGSVLNGSLLGTTFGGAYVSAGATVRLPQRWELVLEGAFQWVPVSFYGGDSGSVATVWQVWMSVGALRFFQTGRPHDGFFVGPKLEGTYQQVGPCSGECTAGYYAANVAGALTITFEAGYRLQFGHFVLSFMFPSVGFGYGWNGSFILSPYVLFDGIGASGFAMSFDLNMLRLGVSF